MGEIQTNPSHVSEFPHIDLGDVEIFDSSSALRARVILSGGINRLAVDAIIAGPGGTFAQGNFDSVPVSETNALAIWVRSAVTAQDGTKVAGSQNVPIAARAALAAQSYDLERLLVDGVIRGDDGTTYSAVAVRNFDADADIAAALVGMTVNARPSCLNFNAGGDWSRSTGTGAASVAGTYSESAGGPVVYQARESEFTAARRGKRFYATHQTPGTLITAQLAFVATTPTFLYRINSASIRAIIRSINLSIANEPGDVIYVCLAIDTTDRYSAGGTAVTLQNSNEESSTTPVGLFYTNPTAANAGATTRYLGTWIVPKAQAANFDVDVGDGILLGPSASSLLLYVWAATTAPTLVFTFDLEEVT